MAAPLRSQTVLSSSIIKCYILSSKGKLPSIRTISKRLQRVGCLNSTPRCPHRLRLLGQKRYQHILGVIAVRHASTESSNLPPGYVTDNLPSGYIPDVPQIPIDDIPVSLPELNALGEPTLQSLGLGGYWPSGLFQQFLELIHVSLDIPWWTSIGIVVVCIRLMLFPLFLKQKRNTVNMGNHMPTISRLQQRITDAKATGNFMEMSRKTEELQSYIARNDIKVSMFLVPLAQVPIFMSVFFGLRQMSSLPVESMRTGGLAWFTDLTIADPYYLLPLMTSATLLAMVELGVESNKAENMTHLTKWLIRGMPVIVFLMTSNFPASMGVYWACNNMFSLLQGQILNIKVVREYFNVPEVIKHRKEDFKKKKFVQGFKDSYQNSKMTKAAQDRKQVDEMDFKKAGSGPIPKTYTYDPTKVKKSVKM